MPSLADADARRTALTDRTKSLLVEAGAGSGKTALMAGRITLLLADETPPSTIAAITFTELAAAELAERVRLFALDLLDGTTPPELEVAVRNGLTTSQRAALERGVTHLDDLTVTTIHGFALELIRPYPAESDMDPGARPMDASESALMFDDVFQRWIRDRLSRPDDGSDVLAQLVLAQSGDGAVKWIRTLAEMLKDRPNGHAPSGGDAPFLADALHDFRRATADFVRTVRSSTAPPQKTLDVAAALERLSADWDGRDETPLRIALRIAYERPSPPFVQAGTLAKRIGSKKDWQQAAQGWGGSKADGDYAYDQCKTAYEAVLETFPAVEASCSTPILEGAVQAAHQVRDLYATRKREAALLDFHDLLFLAAHMLRRHPTVRDALAQKYQHILVDEFQDTDPLQAEIVWRLTSEVEDGDWQSWPCRGSARFVVGDPKQSIYRFRRADVETYLSLRERMREDPNADELTINTNFRSVTELLNATNETFEMPLSTDGQPGYVPLAEYRESSGNTAIARLDIPLPDGADPGKGPNLEDARRVEAKAVAQLCARLMRGSEELGADPVEASDIALLAPVGTSLWRYERELELMGIPVASQAGKGFYQRQEIQDLVALSRALADISDTVALGALLRGPLVGVSEERLLDAAEALHASADAGAPVAPRLSLSTDPDLIRDEGIRRVVSRLTPLARRALGRTPYQTLSAALEQLEVRAIIRQRHDGRAERALANVERFLEGARPWAARGLRAFARDAYARWLDSENALEGRPEAEEGAVTLITTHSAKGLEWRVVVPINMMGEPRKPDALFMDHSGCVWARIGKAAPAGFDTAYALEDAAESAEDIRLLYVAATRARDLMVIPKTEWPLKPRSWLALSGLDALEGPHVTASDATPFTIGHETSRAQTPDQFQQEARRISENTKRVTWSAPSRHDVTESLARKAEAVKGLDDGLLKEIEASERADQPTTEAGHGEGERGATSPIAVPGRTRGLILHALMEGLINGVFSEEDLAEQASVLLARLAPLQSNQVATPDPEEMAATVRRTWALPALASVRGNLMAEVDLYGTRSNDRTEELVSGIADAIALDPNGDPELVIDWKSDVDPTEATIATYREQVKDYLELTGVDRGWLVFMTKGALIEVPRSSA